MFATRLTQSEREKLARLLSQQARIAPDTKSAETVHRFVDDMEGTSHEVGGESKKVVVGPDNIPQIVSEQHAKILDCRHVVTSISEILGVCSFGHIVCYREKLYRCPECKRKLCEEDIEEENGELVCRACRDKRRSEQAIFIVIGMVIALLVIILMAKR